MSNKFVVVWGSKDGSKKGVPADERFYAENEEGAKTAARDLLVKSRTTDLMPLSVLSLTEEEAESLIVSERPMEELMPDEDFILLAA